MKTPILIVALLIVAVAAGAAGYLVVSSKSGTSTNSNTNAGSSSNGIEVNTDTVTVNANLGTGAWDLTLGNTGSLTVSSITAYLNTPTPAYICSGSDSSAGLFYKNCPSTAGTPLPPGSTVSGDSDGAGPASATPGTSYTMDVHLAFTSGTTAWLNTTVTATS